MERDPSKQAITMGWLRVQDQLIILRMNHTQLRQPNVVSSNKLTASWQWRTGLAAAPGHTRSIKPDPGDSHSICQSWNPSMVSRGEWGLCEYLHAGAPRDQTARQLAGNMPYNSQDSDETAGLVCEFWTLHTSFEYPLLSPTSLGIQPHSTHERRSSALPGLTCLQSSLSSAAVLDIWLIIKCVLTRKIKQNFNFFNAVFYYFFL